MDDIQNAFEKYYIKLYAQPQAVELTQVHNFISSLDLSHNRCSTWRYRVEICAYADDILLT